MTRATQRNGVGGRCSAVVAACATLGLLGSSCASRERDDHERAQVVQEAARAPEGLMPGDLASRPDTALLHNAQRQFDTDDGAQPDTLPKLPERVSLQDIRTGDALFHGKGGCINCHGAEVQGLAGRGSSMTNGLHLVQADDQRGIDSIIVNGIADAETRSPIGMPPRGQRGDLTTDETLALSAYIWAVAHVRGEPWPGGHRAHAAHAADASARTLIP